MQLKANVHVKKAFLVFLVFRKNKIYRKTTSLFCGFPHDVRYEKSVYDNPL